MFENVGLVSGTGKDHWSKWLFFSLIEPGKVIFFRANVKLVLISRFLFQNVIQLNGTISFPDSSL